MSHTHSHGHTSGNESSGPPRKALAAVLAGVVGLLVVAVAIGVVALWPDSSKLPKDANPYTGKGVSIVSGTVQSVKAFDCGSGGAGPDGLPSVKGDCAHVTATSGGAKATFDVDAARYKTGIHHGDKVQLIKLARSGQPTSYQFLDFERGVPLTAIAIIFALLVIAVARLRGLFAIVGIAVTLVALMKFMLPAFLAGESPLPVAIVGSAAIMIVVLYLAHGVSIRTTAALFGTLGGLVLTAAAGIAATSWTNLTGIGTEDDQTLAAVAPHLHFSGVVAASMVVAGLGVLNDVTVTQASAVWEMRALQPLAKGRELFTSAMRIGRDHIASSVYTLVFAYAGSAMTILLLITAYHEGLARMATTEEIGQEIVRTLVGAIGLVLAVPVTTVIAVWLAPKGTDALPGDGVHGGEPEPTPPLLTVEDEAPLLWREPSTRAYGDPTVTRRVPGRRRAGR